MLAQWRIILLLLGLFVFWLPSGQAQVVLGKYAGEFLAFGVGARALAMGGTATALAQDVTAGYWNPAGLSHINYPQIALMHSQSFGNVVNYNYAAAAIPFEENKSLGLSVMRLGVSDIPDTRSAWDEARNRPIDNAENLITRFGAADWAVLASYSVKTPYKLSYGLSAKFIFRNVGTFANAFGVGVDAGVLYELGSCFTVGIAVQDITTTFVSWTTGRNELIAPTAKLGGGYTLEALFGRFTVGIDIDTRFEGRKHAAHLSLGTVSFNFRGGLEYAYKNIVAIRAGIDDIGRLTLGAGLRIAKLNIDYSFARFDGTDQLGNSHRISLQLELDQEIFRRKGYVPPPEETGASEEPAPAPSEKEEPDNHAQRR
ncbi:MAG: PorV/PorQ family protein [Chloroherpetonaceae bacterium]|nr:PorV/PorQ family protein [Chloroherpetonaceae bacterium]MCS7212419.1 PorV/PorQ family protein [Chloroherpetonaceae bacterium]